MFTMRLLREAGLVSDDLPDFDRRLIGDWFDPPRTPAGDFDRCMAELSVAEVWAIAPGPIGQRGLVTSVVKLSCLNLTLMCLSAYQGRDLAIEDAVPLRGDSQKIRRFRPGAAAAYEQYLNSDAELESSPGLVASLVDAVSVAYRESSSWAIRELDESDMLRRQGAIWLLRGDLIRLGRRLPMEQFDEDTASIDEIVDEQQIDAIAGALHKLVDLATS